MMPGPSTELYITSDMFYVEVLLEPTGAIKDVKIHHEGKSDPQVTNFQPDCLLHIGMYKLLIIQKMCTIISLFPCIPRGGIFW